MREILQFLALISVSLPIAAQDKMYTIMDEPLYECIYTYTINGEVQETYYTALQIGRQFTRFYDYSAYAVDSLSFMPDASEEEMGILTGRRQTAMFFFDAEFFQNLPSDKMTVVQEAVPHRFSYQEDLSAFDWVIKFERDSTICGYSCKEATTTYGGRKWTVWFSPDIPASSGPWKFNGLPGLVLAAKDSEGLHEFKAIVFRKGISPIFKPEHTDVHESTREKVLKAKATSEKNIAAGIKPDKSEIKDYFIIMNLSGDRLDYYNGMAVRNRPNGFQPLEITNCDGTCFAKENVGVACFGPSAVLFKPCCGTGY